MSDDAQRLRDALAASGFSARRFATLLDVDARTVEHWLAGGAMPWEARALCAVIVKGPSIAARLAATAPLCSVCRQHHPNDDRHPCE